jgi:hypothetical protein
MNAELIERYRAKLLILFDEIVWKSRHSLIRNYAAIREELENEIYKKYKFDEKTRRITALRQLKEFIDNNHEKFGTRKNELGDYGWMSPDGTYCIKAGIYTDNFKGETYKTLKKLGVKDGRNANTRWYECPTFLL